MNYSNLVNLIPNMTSNTTPSGVASASSSYDGVRVAWKAFNGIEASTKELYAESWISKYRDNAWISYEWDNEVEFNIISIQPYPYFEHTVVEFDLEYWNGDGFITEGRYLLNDFVTTEAQYVELTNSIRTSKIRLIRLRNQSSNNDIAQAIGELGVYHHIGKSLLQSNNKTYSLKSIDAVYETKMTSNTTPSPLVASASSEYSSTSYKAYGAFNGVTNSNNGANIWMSAENQITNSWIKLDFGDKKLINKVILTPREAVNINQTPKEFYVEYSNDNNKWFKIKEFNISDWVAYTPKEFVLETVAARYLRIVHLTSNGANRVSWSEITFGFNNSIMYEMNITNENNFIKYGMDNSANISNIFYSKNYILQDTVSENPDGMWETQLNRKPFSIKFY